MRLDHAGHQRAAATVQYSRTGPIKLLAGSGDGYDAITLHPNFTGKYRTARAIEYFDAGK
jgi:hypothetical protein